MSNKKRKVSEKEKQAFLENEFFEYIRDELTERQFNVINELERIREDLSKIIKNFRKDGAHGYDIVTLTEANNHLFRINRTCGELLVLKNINVKRAKIAIK